MATASVKSHFALHKLWTKLFEANAHKQSLTIKKENNFEKKDYLIALVQEHSFLKYRGKLNEPFYSKCLSFDKEKFCYYHIGLVPGHIFLKDWQKKKSPFS